MKTKLKIGTEKKIPKDTVLPTITLGLGMVATVFISNNGKTDSLALTQLSKQYPVGVKTPDSELESPEDFASNTMIVIEFANMSGLDNLISQLGVLREYYGRPLSDIP